MTINEEYFEIATNLIGEPYPLEEINRIIEVISEWEKLISEEAFPIFKYIIEMFCFYSERRVVNTFMEINEKNSFLNAEEALFVPLRHKSTMETSIPLFAHIALSLKIPNERTEFKYFDEIPTELLNKKREYATMIKITEGEILNDADFTGGQNKIKSLMEKLNYYNCSGTELSNNNDELIEKSKKGEDVRKELKKIKKEIKSNEKKIKQTQSEINEIINDYEKKNAKWLQANNIFVFDDFLCSGSSVASSLTDKNIEIINVLKDVNFYFLFLEATQDGVEKVNEIIQNNELNNVDILYLYDSINVKNEIENIDKITIFDDEVRFLNDKYNLHESKYNCKTAIASFINTPNSNYSFLKDEGNGWTPLFKREIRKPVRVNKDNLKNLCNLY